MAKTDEQVLEDLKTVRDAIIEGMSEGQTIIEYQIRGRMKRVTNPAETLKMILDAIAEMETKIGRSQRSPNRVVKLFGPSI